MKNKLLILLLIFGANLYSQIIHGSFTCFPKEYLINEINTNIIINPKSNFNFNTHYIQQMNLEDFDFKTSKPIKNVSYYLNDDKIVGYYLEFDKEGRITKLEDNIKNVLKIYNYSKEFTIIQKYLKKQNNRLFGVDSICFDERRNIVRKSYNSFNDEHIPFIQNIEDYEYDIKNRIIRKYDYGYDLTINKFTYLNKACFYIYNNDKIIEKADNSSHKCKGIEFKKDSTLFKFDSERLFQINSKGNFTKIQDKFNNKVNKTTNIKYDNKQRIVSLTFDGLAPWYSFYKYQKENIVEIVLDNGKSIYKYDNYGNVISDDDSTNKLSYDINKNWIYSESSNKRHFLYKVIRDIRYY